MRERISRLAGCILAGLFVVCGALTFWQIVAADDVLRGASNPRLIEADRRGVRGRILDRKGEILASSERIGDLAVRSYPYPSLAHVTGYLSPRVGKTGIEEAFDAYLRGDRGTDVWAALRTRLLGSREPGVDVVLTIDLGVQRAADEALGSATGAIVAMDARTGAVLALASHPFFDPNLVDERWESLLADPALPLVNRPLEGHYVPGSVFKLVTAAAGLDLGVVTPEQRHRHEGDLVVDGFRIRNTNHPQLTDLSFAEEFAWSCNPAFALLGLSLGSKTPLDLGVLSGPQPFVWTGPPTETSARLLIDYARRFHIGERVPFDLPTSGGRVPDPVTTTPAQLASAGFGQGDLQVSPLQMALVAATIANEGAMPSPSLVAEVRGSGAHVAVGPSEATPRQVIAPATARALNAMMMLSVEAAYARPARIPGVAVAGKTGTAETGGGKAPHAWFVGYAPADRPGVAVAVIMENRGSGTQFAAPAGRQVLEAALRLGY